MANEKNMEIRVELLKAGLNQGDLADLMGKGRTDISMALSVAEWAPEEKTKAIDLIRANAKIKEVS